MNLENNETVSFLNVPNPENHRFINIDLETGGLNDATHEDDLNIPVGKNGAQHYAILQIAVIVTDGHFNEIGEPLNIVIHNTKEELETRTSEWSKNQFADTLMKQCPESDISLEKAMEMAIEHIVDNGAIPQKCFLAGNSIRLDRAFISEQMKELNDFMHYRQLDASSLKLMMGMFFGDQAYIKKKMPHDALDDIRESIEELKFYVNNFLDNSKMAPRIEPKNEQLNKKRPKP